MTVRRVKSLGFVWVMYRSGTWNRQAKNKLEGKTAMAYGKNKPQDDLQMSKLPAKPSGEDYTSLFPKHKLLSNNSGSPVVNLLLILLQAVLVVASGRGLKIPSFY